MTRTTGWVDVPEQLDLIAALTLTAVVLVVASLAAGVVERAPLSFPIIFLVLGFALGPWGAGLLNVDAEGPALETIGVVTLSLVLFLDAVHLETEELRREWRVPALVLGPGTALVIGLTTVAGMLLLDLDVVTALLLGTVLASTDPVVLRDVLRDTRIPKPVRRTLSVEAGTNDLVVLPTLLVLLAIKTADPGGTNWPLVLTEMFVLGPAVGFAIGGAGAKLMGRADARFGVREEYQSLYGVGLVLLSYVAGEAVGGDGFLAAFAAGFAVAVLNTDLCSCFLDFGQVVSEMAMLAAFVFFGAALSGAFTQISLLPAVMLALLVLLAIRPASIGLVLTAHRRNLSWPARAFIAWFGPRGLASLLFALLVLREGGGDVRLLAVVGVVVTASVLVHGVTATPLTGAYAGYIARHTTHEERARSASGLFTSDDPAVVPRVSADELTRQLAGPSPPTVLDVRTRSALAADPDGIPGSTHVLPDEVRDWGARQLHHHPVVLYCT
ncbi:MAG: hypothetical protein GEV03_28585 [Streptosporangiales bacterium]|nr:hypothetical protein [Streptosporangiales bacterium]